MLGVCEPALLPSWLGKKTTNVGSDYLQTSPMRTRYYTFSPPTLPPSLSLSHSLSLSLSVSLYLSLSLSLSLSLAFSGLTGSLRVEAHPLSTVRSASVGFAFVRVHMPEIG